jgi:uncharacterized protein YjiS (DUF1127 family)
MNHNRTRNMSHIAVGGRLLKYQSAAAAHQKSDRLLDMIGNRASWLMRWLAICTARHSQRKALAQLDDYRLRDIGKSRREAKIEAAKPFWRE